MPKPLFEENNNQAQQPVQQAVQQPVFNQPTIAEITTPNMGVELVSSATGNSLSNKLSKLDNSQRQQLESYRNAIVVNDYKGLSQYGTQASEVVNKLADGVLQSTQANALDMVGDKINQIMCEAKGLDVGKLGRAQNPGFFAKILPWLRVTKEKFMKEFDTASGQIEKYVDEIKKAANGVDQSITLLENMGKQSVVYYNNLDVLILAGKVKVEELYTEVDTKKAYFASLPSDAVDQMELQAFQQTQNFVDTLDKRINDLERIQQVIYMQIPQIQIMIKNSVDMKNQFHTIVNSTIPLWKQQFIQSLVLDQQKRGAEVIKAANDFTNDLLRQNADNLRAASVAIATEGQRGIVDVETLQHVQTQTIATIESVLDLYKKGRENRAKISDDIGKMRDDFRKSLQGKF